MAESWWTLIRPQLCPSRGFRFPTDSIQSDKIPAGLSGQFQRVCGSGHDPCSKEGWEGPDAHGAVSAGGAWVASGATTPSRSC